MQNPFDIKGKILDEVKKLALDIASINTPTGLIINYQKVQTLYEKALFLKILEQERIEMQKIDVEQPTVEQPPKNEEKSVEKDNTISTSGMTPNVIPDINKYYSSSFSHNYNQQSEPVRHDKPDVNDSQPIHKEEIVESVIEEKEVIDILENTDVEEQDEIEQVGFKLVSVGAEVTHDTNNEKGSVIQEQSEDITNSKPEQTTELFANENITSPDVDVNYKEKTEQELEEEYKNRVKLASIKGLHQTNITETPDISKRPESLKKTNPLGGFKQSKYALRLDLNDRLAFQKKLFNDDNEELKKVIDKLNSFDSLDEAKEYLSDLYYDKNWETVDAYAQRLWSLVENRYS